MYQEFQIQLTDLTVDNLLEQFTLAKHTGLEKPGKLHESTFPPLKKVPLIEPLFCLFFDAVGDLREWNECMQRLGQRQIRTK